MNTNEYGVIIASDRDRIEFDYILQTRGGDWVRFAIKNLVGNRKPYVSNLSKIMKLEMPDNLPDKQKVLSSEEVDALLAQKLPQFRRKKKVEDTPQPL